MLRVRALAELRAGQTDAAFHDVQLLLRLSHALENEPLLISLLVRNASITQTFQPIWEGLAEYRWNEEQLKKLQQELAEINLLAHLDLAIHGERCMAKWCLDRLLADPKMLRELTTMNGEPSKSYGGPWNLIPSSFVYFNCLNVELFYQRH
ncbi:MAG: hypothetical protein NTY53_27290, partial [Kiritimatiellaeota bacterium]|nr:hypothetical protein [Kiritimatiellota bacterium]